MQELKLHLGDRTYTIYLGVGRLQEIGRLCKKNGLGKKAAIITNPTVAGYYLRTIYQSLKSEGYTVKTVQISDGETYKNIESLSYIYDELIRDGFTRDSFLIALGGGVIGDITGFAASTFLRGIQFVQVPTTLLAQVDSSVGGKTGINHDLGKNLIGTFYQPSFVLIDQSTLATLENREYLSGLAEIVKYGAVIDYDLFRLLESSIEALIHRDKDVLARVILKSCEIKSLVVEKDELESGYRAVLNYGHTFAHAVEQLTLYANYLHGEAVAMGMVHAAKLSNKMGYATTDDLMRITALLHSLGLPTKLAEFPRDSYKNAIIRDKKVRDGGINFVFNKGIGDSVIEKITDLDALLYEIP